MLETMSVEGTTPAAGTSATSSRPRGPRGRGNPAHDDNAPPYENVHVYVLDRAVVISTPGLTRIENPERGTTDYGAPLPVQTRRALREVANGC